jgi:hypothetical protein
MMDYQLLISGFSFDFTFMEINQGDLSGHSLSGAGDSIQGREGCRKAAGSN